MTEKLNSGPGRVQATTGQVSNDAEHLARKRELWDKKMSEMLKPDVFGYVLDEGMRDAVVALQLLGFNTTQSDQGNYSESPWVEVMAEYPKNVYEGEVELKTRLLNERAIRSEEIDPVSPSFNRVTQVEIESAAHDELARVGASYTPEYNEWRTKTLESAVKLQKIIDEFNLAQQEKHPDGMRIGIEFPYRTSDHPHPAHIQDIPNLRVLFDETKNNTSEEEQLNRSARAREEMRRFSNFLKERYFSS